MSARLIDHDEAMQNMIAERYLLGELSEGDRDAYEEHLFACPICFEQVKAGSEFVGHLRRIGTEEPTPTLMSGFMSQLVGGMRNPAAISALCLFLLASGIAVRQNSIITRLKEPRPELRSVLTGIAHGFGATTVLQVSKNSELSLHVEYARKGEFTHYLAQIVSSSGKLLHTIALPETQTGTMASIAMPAEALNPGQYSIVVIGRRSDGTQEEVGRGSFDLQFKSN
ncbi:MAG TPA: zf-HC2 domain-containing protein [Candidatus Angelobacter sp.]|jgi:hypothetical protein